jgi:hypothetical protein
MAWYNLCKRSCLLEIAMCIRIENDDAAIIDAIVRVPDWNVEDRWVRKRGANALKTSERLSGAGSHGQPHLGHTLSSITTR